MTQDEADRALGKIIREGIAKAMPLASDKANQLYINVDLAGLGPVLVGVRIWAAKTETTH